MENKVFASVKTADGVVIELEGNHLEVDQVLDGFGVSRLIDQVHVNETNHAIQVVEAIFGEVERVNEIAFSTPTDEELDAAANEAEALVNASDVASDPYAGIYDGRYDDDDVWGYGW